MQACKNMPLFLNQVTDCIAQLLKLKLSFLDQKWRKRARNNIVSYGFLRVSGATIPSYSASETLPLFCTSSGYGTLINVSLRHQTSVYDLETADSEFRPSHLIQASQEVIPQLQTVKRPKLGSRPGLHRKHTIVSAYFYLLHLST